MKKGQVSVYLILGILVVLLVGVLAFNRNQLSKTAYSNVQQWSINLKSDQISRYIEQCMHNSGYNGLFDKIAPNGGYISVKDNPEYGIFASVPFIEYQDHDVSVWADTLNDLSPSLSVVEEQLSRYTYVETKKCIREIGLIFPEVDIEYPDLGINDPEFGKDIKTQATINYGHIDLVIYLPIKVSLNGTTKELRRFHTRLNYDYGRNFELSKILVKEIINRQPLYYDFKTFCGTYKTNGFSNIYSLQIYGDPSVQKFVVSLFDYEPIYVGKRKTLKMQFATLNARVTGDCI